MNKPLIAKGAILALIVGGAIALSFALSERGAGSADESVIGANDELELEATKLRQEPGRKPTMAQPKIPSLEHAQLAQEELAKLRSGEDNEARNKRYRLMNKNLIARLESRLNTETMSDEEMQQLTKQIEELKTRKGHVDHYRPEDDPMRNKRLLKGEMVKPRQVIADAAQGRLVDIFKKDGELNGHDPDWLVDTLYTMHDIETIEVDANRDWFVQDQAIRLARHISRAEKHLSDPLERDAAIEEAKALFIKALRRAEAESKQPASASAGGR